MTTDVGNVWFSRMSNIADAKEQLGAQTQSVNSKGNASEPDKSSVRTEKFLKESVCLRYYVPVLSFRDT